MFKYVLGELAPRKRVILFILVIIFFSVALLPTPVTIFNYTLVDYLPLHIFLETISIVVSMQAFVMAWENKASQEKFVTTFVGLSFLAAALIDFAHILSFPGMPDFVTPASGNKAIYFWLVGRLVIASALFFLVISDARKIILPIMKVILLVSTLILVAIIYLVGIFCLDFLPPTFIDGSGLTLIKIYLEIFLFIVLLITQFILIRRSSYLANFYDLENITMAIFTMAMSEILFTMFNNHYDSIHVTGHLYKVVSFFFLYRAFFHHGIQIPYNQLNMKNQKLIEAQKIAETASVAKTQFLANMSHEIRTPLNAILGFTQVLDESNLPVSDRVCVDKIQKAGEILLRLLNDIIDFARIEAHRIKIEETPFKLDELVETVITLTSVEASKKGVEVVYHVDKEVPRVLIGDEYRLKQVFINLLSNATKYTEKGTITLLANHLFSERGKVRVKFIVKDTGIGIPYEHQRNLFTAFSQADTSSSRRYGGAGLGLAICHRLVSLMGGDIHCLSSPKEGTEFNFELEFNYLDELVVTGKPLDKSSKIDLVRFDRNNILVVEDNELNQLLIKEILTQRGANVCAVESGETALDLLREGPNKFDLVLMDIQLPQMNGYETTWQIRNKLGLKLPIVALTAQAIAGDREKCLAAGMDSYIAKPVNVTLLVHEIQAVLIKHQTKD